MLLSRHSPHPRAQALVEFARRGRRQSAQALVEFALILTVFMMLVVTSLNMIPAITARGVVLDTAVASVERVARYLTPQNSARSITAGQQRLLLCQQLETLARVQIQGALGDPNITEGSKIISPTPTQDCRSSADVSHNPAVNVTLLAASTNQSAGSYGPGAQVQVCLSYIWSPKGGLVWLFSQAPGQIGYSVQNAFTYRYCAPGVIDAKRTR